MYFPFLKYLFVSGVIVVCAHKKKDLCAPKRLTGCWKKVGRVGGAERFGG